MIHVVPTDESHRLDTTCDCEPKVQFLSEIFVVHNARELEPEGWLVLQSEDNYPINIMEDGAWVPVQIEQ